MSSLEKAIEIARKAHENMVDKYDQPYIGHVTRVMNMGTTTDEKIVGILHDVVEDTDWTFEQLEAEGFSPHVIAALKCITKQSDDEDYDAFIERITHNDLAIRVKLNDLLDNMDIRRMPVITENDVPRLNKYLRAYKKLQALIGN